MGPETGSALGSHRGLALKFSFHVSRRAGRLEAKVLRGLDVASSTESVALAIFAALVGLLDSLG